MGGAWVTTGDAITKEGIGFHFHVSFCYQKLLYCTSSSYVGFLYFGSWRRRSYVVIHY